MKPHNKSPAKANQEIHWTMFRIANVFALGVASNAGQEKATKKTNAKNVKVPLQNFDNRSALLA